MINDILNKCNELEIVHDRVRKDDYAEIVFPTAQTEKWTAVLQEFLGPMAKAPSQNASKDQDKLTKDYGGINKDQTLFMKEVNDDVFLAMYWPWGNGEHTTLKLAKTNLPKKGFLDNLFSS